MILWLYDSGAEEMQRNLFWLTDEQWRKTEPHLPTDVRGKDRVDDRRVISGILHVLKSGCRWCDCPPEYGPRYQDAARRGLALEACRDVYGVAIDIIGFDDYVAKVDASAEYNSIRFRLVAVYVRHLLLEL